jgi:hypothetical protein
MQLSQGALTRRRGQLGGMVFALATLALVPTAVSAQDDPMAQASAAIAGMGAIINSVDDPAQKALLQQQLQAVQNAKAQAEAARREAQQSSAQQNNSWPPRFDFSHSNTGPVNTPPPPPPPSSGDSGSRCDTSISFCSVAAH